MENVGRNPIPIELVNKRREYSVELCRTGLSFATVLAKVNELNTKHGWGEISLRTLQRDITSYYQKQSAHSQSEIDQARYLRQNHLAAMETTVEMARLNIAQKDATNSWTHGERNKAIESLFRMQKDIAQLNGWDFGKTAFMATTGIRSFGPKTEFEIFDEASVELDENPDASAELTKLFNDAIERIRANNGSKNALTVISE